MHVPVSTSQHHNTQLPWLIGHKHVCLSCPFTAQERHNDSISTVYRPSRRTGQADCRRDARQLVVSPADQLRVATSAITLCAIVQRQCARRLPCHHAWPGKHRAREASVAGVAGSSASWRWDQRRQREGVDEGGRIQSEFDTGEAWLHGARSSARCIYSRGTRSSSHHFCSRRDTSANHGWTPSSKPWAVTRTSWSLTSAVVVAEMIHGLSP